VKKGQELLVVEAMKMENPIRAPHDGRVARIDARVGEMVGPGQLLVEIE
jgi:biotin carboxyl carrier protein